MRKAMGKGRQMSVEESQTLALRAFTFLADEPARMGRFLALTGIDPASVREHAANPGFLGGILEYMLQDETLLLTFSAEAHVDPTLIAVARRIIDSSGKPCG